MAKRVEVQTNLTAAELRERYRQASEPVERTHWQILWLMKEGHTPGEVAERVGYTALGSDHRGALQPHRGARDQQSSFQPAWSQALADSGTATGVG